jgi:hypothetical protein
MSIVGFSPSDIIAGGKAIKKAASGIREDGSKSLFQEADDALDSRIAASDAVLNRSPDGSVPQLLRQDRDFTKNQETYRRFLGSQASPSLYRKGKGSLEWTLWAKRKWKTIRI